MRLTNVKRDSITEKEINKKFYDKESELRKDLIETIQSEVKKTIPAFITDEIVNAGYIRTSNIVVIDGLQNGLVKSRYPSQSFNMFSSYPIKAYRNRHTIKLTKLIEVKYKKVERLLEEKEKFKSDLKKVLYSFTTDTKLLEHLPELSEYFEKKNATAIIPIEQIENVRKALHKTDLKAVN